MSPNNTTSLAVSSLVAHAGINPETQREFQLEIMRVLNNAPSGFTVQQKQLALIVALDELAKAFPGEHQVNNSLAVVATLLIGPRALMAISGLQAAAVDPKGLQ